MKFGNGVDAKICSLTWSLNWAHSVSLEKILRDIKWRLRRDLQPLFRTHLVVVNILRNKSTIAYRSVQCGIFNFNGFATNEHYYTSYSVHEIIRNEFENRLCVFHCFLAYLTTFYQPQMSRKRSVRKWLVIGTKIEIRSL